MHNFFKRSHFLKDLRALTYITWKNGPSNCSKIDTLLVIILGMSLNFNGHVYFLYI